MKINYIKSNNKKLMKKILINILNKYDKNKTYKLFRYNFIDYKNIFFINLLENENFLKENNLNEYYYFIFNNKETYKSFIYNDLKEIFI